jgi:hypothetical protein
MKIITTGQIFLLNYHGFLNKLVNVTQFFFLGTQVQTKNQNSAKFQITDF